MAINCGIDYPVGTIYELNGIILQVSYVDNSVSCKDTDCKGNSCYAASGEMRKIACCRSFLCINRKDNRSALIVRIRYRIYLL